MGILDCFPCYEGRPDYDPSLGTAIVQEERLSRSRLISLDNETSDAPALPNGNEEPITAEPQPPPRALTCDSDEFSADTENLSGDGTSTGGLFFRSKLNWQGNPDYQGQVCNEIAVALEQNQNTLTDYDLIVYFQGLEVEQYSTTQPSNCAGEPGGVGNGGSIADLRMQTAVSNYISMPARGTDIYDIDGIDPTCIIAFSKINLKDALGPGESEVPAYRTGPDRSFIFIRREKDIGQGEIYDGEPYMPPVNENLRQWNFDIPEFTTYIVDADCRPEGTDC